MKRRPVLASLGLGLILAAGCGGSTETADPGAPDRRAAQNAGLPQLGLPLAGITVSGISAGGYMATQFHLAHADWIDGVAVLAAGPWRCAEGRLQQALGRCIDGGEAELETGRLAAEARELAAAGRLAAATALAGDRVWIFRGTRDTVISAGVVRASAAFYREYAPEATVMLREDIDAVHGWPTMDFGAACEGFDPPYLTACGVDVAGHLLEALLGNLTSPEAAAPEEGLRRFDQRPFWPARDGHSLHESGWVYVPQTCREGGSHCRLHVVFHGCRQSEDFIGEAFVRHTGLNAWAEANGLVVLYPQVRPSRLRPLNPQGCWDWWGYSGANYVERGAAQIAAVAAMLRHLAETAHEAADATAQAR